MASRSIPAVLSSRCRVRAAWVIATSVLLVLIWPGSPGTAVAATIDFNRQIRPVISSKCFACHGADESSRKAKLRLDLREEAIKERDGRWPVNPGQPDQSELIRRITSTDPEEVMPPPKSGHHVTAEEVPLFRQWIAEGAHYAEHWSFQKPVRPSPPAIIDVAWPRNGLDWFVLSKLEGTGLKPSSSASPYALIRRLSLDLTGLPPTPTEVDAFIHDPSPHRYERLVDRLLAAPAFGERWARPWLDLARYADSAGYGSDPLRLNMYPWRDWVIAALNQNMTFDEFTREQLAGDLIANPTEEQLVATAFHRNTMTNTEGGTDDEEWRVAAVKDRVNVTLQGWMGLTVGCAQCHTHKFDPVSQREYYQLFAIFNQTEDNDQPDERPTLPIPTLQQRNRIRELNSELASVRARLATPSSDLKEEFAAWERARQQTPHWTTLLPREVDSKRGATLTIQDDQSILATEATPAKDVYTITAPLAAKDVTAVRLEVLPDSSLAGKGPGRSTNGSFVLTNFRITSRPEGSAAPRARFVRLQLPGSERMLSLAEVEVFSGGTNAARSGQARQSSTDYGGKAALAIDGNTDGDFDKARSTTHTRSEESPWWELDLGAETIIEAIKVWNRTDHSLASRLDGVQVQTLTTERVPVWESTLAKAPTVSTNIVLDGARLATLVNASADTGSDKFSIGKSISAKAEPGTGWSAGQGDGRGHVAIFELGSSLEPGLLTITLEQNAGQQQTIGRFRLSTTTLPAPVRIIPPEIETALHVSPTERTEAQEIKLWEWFGRYARTTAPLHARVNDLQSKLAAVNPNPLPVMRQVASEKRRVSHLMNKGNFLDPGEVVKPALLGSFHSSANVSPDRLGLAAWLVSADNPLTARVVVNRFWAQLFGIGLVETEEDFGTQGQPPSHPELLDWLALDFSESGWDVKRLLRTMVLSATYRQGAQIKPDALSKDPRNRLLAYFPRRRLDAEMIRDQALALSGLLTTRIGGPSVYPPQPDGLWRAAFNGERTYPTSSGADRYRRALYTVWRRTTPYPGMATFDAPSRETCTFRRLPTNTPLQAYVTLNDPVFVEAAQALGRRIFKEGGITVEDRVRWGLQLALVRPPETLEVDELVALYRTVVADYRQRETDARRLATEPLGALPDGLSAVEAAAWTAVANVLLNLDGVLTKS